ncbi:VPS9A, partial [Symbiodinium microadriaticum]
ANPPHLQSTISYLQSYMSPQKLVSEAGYILTHFVSAVHFLDTVDASALTISPLEFETSIARCRNVGMEFSSYMLQKKHADAGSWFSYKMTNIAMH